MNKFECKCILQGYSILSDGNFVIFSGFSNGQAVKTVENKSGFEKITIADARAIFNNQSACPLTRVEASLLKRHNKHINKFLKGSKHEHF